MSVFQLLALVYKRSPLTSFGAVVLLLIAASLELLGLASLLPVASALFDDHSATIPVLEWLFGVLGIQRLSVEGFLLFVCAAIILRGMALSGSLLLIARMSSRLEEELSGRLVETTLRSRWSFLLALGTPKIVDATTRQAAEIGWMITFLGPFVSSTCLSIAFFAAVAWLSPYSLISAMIIGAPLAGILLLLRRVSFAAAQSLLPLSEERSKEVIETLHHAKYLKVSNSEQRATERIRSLLARIRIAGFKLQTSGALMAAFPDTLVVLGVAGLIWTIHSNNLDHGGRFLLSLMLMYRAFQYANQAQSVYHSIRHYLPSLSNVMSLAAEAEVQVENSGNTRELKFERRIAFDAISFSYSPNEPVLSTLSFEIQKNDFIAVRGRSGAGKTTLIDLLVGLHRPDSGRVLIDDTELTPEYFHSWREKISYIPQEPPVFSGTIRANLLRENPDSSEKQMLEAVRMACLDDVTASRSGGLDIEIGERGMQLSGGQRQRLLIARALLRNVDVLILDEPTSAVDPEAEAEIYTRLIRHIRGSKTLIVVTHRENPAIEGARTLQL